MKTRIARSLYALAILAAGASSARAQSTAAEDSTLRKQVRMYLDSIARDKTAPQYSKRAQAKIDTLTMRHVKSAPPPPVNVAPVARFTVPAGGCIVGKICTFNGSTSTDDKAIAGYTWDCNVVPQCNSTGATASAVYPHAGETRTVTLTVRDAEGLANTMTRTVSIVDSAVTPPLPDSVPPVDTTAKPDTGLGITPPAQPVAVPDFQPKPCARSVDVPIVANLQTYLNNAASGDCLELQPGTEYKGNFTLPNHACASATDWITIRTKGVLDVPGVRVLPAQAIAERWSKITQANNQYAFVAAHPSRCWQIMHLNIQRDTLNATTLVYHLFVIGSSASEGNTSIATNPTDFIVRRNWIHGTVNGELVRCLAVNGIRIAVVDNWIDDCHASGFDSQAIEGWTGAGPILIANNFAAGAGENIMFGGADPSDSTTRPSDITIVRNHVYKDPAWKGRWSIKNIFELKDAQRLRIDGNVFENSWAASQIGFAIVFKSSTGGVSSTVRQGSTDITFTNNRVNNSNLGLNVQAQDCTAQACIVYRVARVVIRNNLLTNIGTSNGITGSGWLNPTYGAPNDILVINNTFVGNTPARGLSMYLSGGAQADWNNIRWRKNIFAGQAEYAIGADCAQPTHMPALDCMIGTGGKWTFADNVVSGVLATYVSKNPPGNTYKATQAEIGLQPDFSAPNFPGIGADVAAIAAKTNGVVMQAGLAARKPPTFKPRAIRRSPADVEWCARNACTLTSH